MISMGLGGHLKQYSIKSWAHWVKPMSQDYYKIHSPEPPHKGNKGNGLKTSAKRPYRIERGEGQLLHKSFERIKVIHQPI
jgi:hypothetical protein